MTCQLHCQVGPVVVAFPLCEPSFLDEVVRSYTRESMYNTTSLIIADLTSLSTWRQGKTRLAAEVTGSNRVGWLHRPGLAGLQQLRTGEKGCYLLPLAKGGRNSQSSAWTLVPSGQAEIFTEIPRPRVFFFRKQTPSFLASQDLSLISLISGWACELLAQFQLRSNERSAFWWVLGRLKTKPSRLVVWLRNIDPDRPMAPIEHLLLAA